MFTPYDWQEGIHNRAQYIESKLAQGAPVLAVSLDEGILIYTYRRQVRKIYEIYDRIIYAGVGQQSDVEAVRMAALEFASKEAFNRSEEDVNVQRVVTSLSIPMKKAFSDFSSSPVVARSLFGEVGEHPGDDLYFTLEYDGDYLTSRQAAVISGNSEVTVETVTTLKTLQSLSALDALNELDAIWLKLANPDSSIAEVELKEGLTPEAVLLERSNVRENRFRVLTPDLL